VRSCWWAAAFARYYQKRARRPKPDRSRLTP
jgi:hypothetical protein